MTSGRSKCLPRMRDSLTGRVASVFVAAVVSTALALALVAYLVTRYDQADRALDDALEQSRQNLTVADSMLPAQPGPADYERLMAAFAIRGDVKTLVEAGADTYVSGFDVTRAPITEELATRVAEGNIRYQTVTSGDQPMIVVGSQMRSGAITVYFFFPQGERMAGLARLRDLLIIAGVVLAALGAIAGSLLARRLLGPVKQAARAATRMSGGDLATRLPEGPNEFGVLARSLNEMAGRLDARMTELEAGQARERRFVADVTHELRTPVAALVGEASLLKSKMESEASACSPEIRRLATLVEWDIARLRQLVDDLLEISRLEAQAVEMVIEPFDLGSFVAQAVRAHGWDKTVRTAATPQAGAAPGSTAALSAESVVNADKRRVERIVVNLVENGLGHGAAPVTIQIVRGESGVTGDPGVVEMTVSDSGEGIPDEHLPHVFDRFYKADPSRSTGRGSGLGLAIARENARLLGGDITAANVPGGGALFLVILPAARL